jgi:hypothetical protein
MVAAAPKTRRRSYPRLFLATRRIDSGSCVAEGLWLSELPRLFLLPSPAQSRSWRLARHGPEVILAVEVRQLGQYTLSLALVLAVERSL